MSARNRLLVPIERYMRENTDDPRSVGGALDAIEPIFDHVERGTYDLDRASEIDRYRIAKILNFALSRPVGQTIVVSLASPKPEVRQLLTKTSSDTLARVMRQNVGDGVKERLGDKRWPGLFQAVSETLRYNNMPKYPWDRLYQSVWQGVRGPVSSEVAQTLRTNVFMPVVWYLGCAMLGDNEKIERLHPLMRLLSRHLPLVEHPDHPASWLVLGR